MSSNTASTSPQKIVIHHVETFGYLAIDQKLVTFNRDDIIDEMPSKWRCLWLPEHVNIHRAKSGRLLKRIHSFDWARNKTSYRKQLIYADTSLAFHILYSLSNAYLKGFISFYGCVSVCACVWTILRRQVCQMLAHRCCLFWFMMIFYGVTRVLNNAQWTIKTWSFAIPYGIRHNTSHTHENIYYPQYVRCGVGGALLHLLFILRYLVRCRLFDLLF